MMIVRGYRHQKWKAIPPTTVVTEAPVAAVIHRLFTFPPPAHEQANAQTRRSAAVACMLKSDRLGTR